MGFFETYGKELFALLVPFVTLVLNTIFRARARLLVARPHKFTFLIQPPPQQGQPTQPPQQGQSVPPPTPTADTSSIVITNAGRETATKVEVVLNWRPLCINVWPSRHFSEHIEPDNRCILIFDSLAPNESVGLELLTVGAPMPELITVRSDQCLAQFIEMYPQPTIKPWRRRINALFALFGLGTLVYLAILLVQFLVLRTPLGG